MKSTGNPALAKWLLVTANLLIPLAIYVFATGFFPYKPLLPGLATFEISEYGPPPAPPFDRLVFMVVDALRSDFVYSASSGFEFTQSLIRDGSAMPFTAHATSPTVTMPRLKAITTGSIPSFLDVILNVDESDKSSSLAAQDTWLAQMKAKETGKLVMYGDDTWLKLFPDIFDRADGTSSFFVADFTEVDNNVTRHVPDELENDDWNTMVLHYLGLDHIGHKGGPRSSNMIPKQHEMDKIVKDIFQAMQTEKHLHSTLFVLIGDHGMNDAGNHGASSAGETSPALIFMSPKLKSLRLKLEAPATEKGEFQYYSTVEQSDLAPTLGALLGFPVPKNNLGAFIVDFLPIWKNKQEHIQILMSNARQILAIITTAFGSELFDLETWDAFCSHPESDIQELACGWRALASGAKAAQESTALHKQWVVDASKWLRNAQGLMSSMSSNYDMTRIISGQAVAFLATVAAFSACYVAGCTEMDSFVPFCLMTILYGIMMFASSYVEEEQHFWYWATSAWFAYITLKGLNTKSMSRIGHGYAAAFAFIATRAIRSWNQTGQKFAGEPDLVKLYLSPNPTLLWILVSVAYLWIHRELIRGFSGLPTALNVASTTGIVLAAYSFKVAFTKEDSPELVAAFAQGLPDIARGASLAVRAQVVFVGLGLASVVVFYTMITKQFVSPKASAMETYHYLLTLLVMTQSRATNIPLFLLFDIQWKFVSAQALSPVELAAASLALQHASFFALGGSNAISSIDLSSAYNGVRDFNVVAVGVLTFLGNWAGPAYWTSATLVLLWRRSRGTAGVARPERGVFLAHASVLTAFVAAAAASVMAACTVLRTHLFIWTVFSPKYLYSMAWSLGQHLLINLGLAGLFYWFGTF